MKLTDVNGQLLSIVTTVISFAIAVLTSFHVFTITSAENSAIMVVATAGVGLSLYVYSILNSWATATFDLSRATTLITAFVSAAVALLDAFGVFHFSAEQQAALLGVSGGLAFLGGLVFSYLHTTKQVVAVRAYLLQQSQTRGFAQPRSR